MVRRVANYDREQRKVDAFRECPNCGSRKVRTPRNQRGFAPTGRIAQTPPAAAVSAAAPPQTFSPPPAQASSATHADQVPTVPAQRHQPLALSPASPSAGAATAAALKRFYLRHWRLLWAAFFAVAPLTSIGDSTTYSHSAVVNVLQFVGTLLISWLAAAFFFSLDRRRRKALATR